LGNQKQNKATFWPPCYAGGPKQRKAGEIAGGKGINIQRKVKAFYK